MTTTKTDTHTLEFKNTHIPGLTRALANCLLFAGKDSVLPVLTCVRFEFDGTQLRLVSTDRYRLCVETIEHAQPAAEDQLPREPFHFLLEGHHAKALLAQLKRDRLLPLTITYDGHTMRAIGVEGSSEFRTYEGTFPQYQALIPSEDNRKAVDEIGFTYPFLAELGKVQTGSKSKHIRVHTYGPNKPVRIDYLEGPTLVQMPVKVGEATYGELSEWGAALS